MNTSHVPVTEWAPLVPELVCRNLARSLEVYTGLFGFTLNYTRPRFAYLSLGRAQLMLEEDHPERGWVTGPLEAPFGRGVNFQIEVPDVLALHGRLEAAGYPVFRPLETATYSEGDVAHTQRQCLVLDPDGYLLRFVG